MAENSMLLHFVPRSLQLNMSKNNTSRRPIKESLNLFASDSKKKRTKGEEDAYAIEEDNPNKKVKKNNSNEYDEVSQELNTRPDSFYQLEDLIAEFLSSRGLSNTLSSFLSEAQHEFTRKPQKAKLEDLYHYYCKKICVSPKKENPVEGKANREITLGKANMDVHRSEENSKKKDSKMKSCMNYNEHVTIPFTKTPNGFSKVKPHASEVDFQRSKKRKSSICEVVNDLIGIENQKIAEKINKKLEPLTITRENSVKLSNASNKLEQVFDFAEPFSKPKKSKSVKNKEVTSDELNMTDNDRQNGGKKSKKVTTLEEDVQPMKCHASHTDRKNGKTVELREDLENPINIEVSKKEKKKKKKKKSDATCPGDDGELGDTGMVITLPQRKPGVTDSKNAKKGSKVESLQDLPVEPSTSPNFEVTKEKGKKLSQMAPADNKRKNKKVKKAQEELQGTTLSNKINGGNKGDKESVSENTGNTQSISMAHQNFEMKRFSISKSLGLKKSSTETKSQNRGMPGREDGAVAAKKHISPKTKENKQKKMEMVKFVEPMAGDDSYWAKDGAENRYGAKAQEVLGQVRGKGFQHEKTKKKRESYTGGTIDLQST